MWNVACCMFYISCCMFEALLHGWRRCCMSWIKQKNESWIKPKIRNILKYSHSSHVWCHRCLFYVVSFIFDVKYCRLHILHRLLHVWRQMLHVFNKAKKEIFSNILARPISDVNIACFTRYVAYLTWNISSCMCDVIFICFTLDACMSWIK